MNDDDRMNDPSNSSTSNNNQSPFHYFEFSSHITTRTKKKTLANIECLYPLL